MHMNILFLKLHTFIPFYHTHILTIYILYQRTYLDHGVQRPLIVDQPPVLAVLGSISDFRMLFRPIPTCLLFLHFWSLSGPIPHWHHLYNNHAIQYQLYHSPEASKHPLLSLTLMSGIPTSTSVLPHATSYFGLINSHDHYLLRP